MVRIFVLIQNLSVLIWGLLVDSAFLLLVGILLAGILHLFINEQTLNRILKGGKNVVVFKSALFGVPLPLCSCSVLPVAHQLRQSGLNRGGTTAFLISTPETGIDSIMLTYSLTDPLMTIARPITAFITALSAGLLVNRTHDRSEWEKECEASKDDICNCSSKKVNNNSVSFIEKIRLCLKYSFINILGDLAPYLFFGYLLAGIAAMVIGYDISGIPENLKTGWGGYAGALVIGLPLYICATSSTPLAAVLLGSGFSPGAILVFLLVGPATNINSLIVVSKILNKGSMIIYLATIIIISILFGIGIDVLYGLLDFNTAYEYIREEHSYELVKIISAIFLAACITYITIKKVFIRFKIFIVSNISLIFI